MSGGHSGLNARRTFNCDNPIQMATKGMTNGDESEFLNKDLQDWYLEYCYTSLRANVHNTLLSASIISFITALITTMLLPLVSPRAIRPKTMLASSLILTTSAAIVGMVVLAWFSMYRTFHGTEPREGLSSSEMRSIALRKWHIPQAISASSTMLIVGLLLFSLGFIDFFWNLTIAAHIGILFYPLIAPFGIVVIYSVLFIVTKAFSAANIRPWPLF